MLVGDARRRREYVRGSGHRDTEEEVVADLGCAVKAERSACGGGTEENDVQPVARVATVD